MILSCHILPPTVLCATPKFPESFIYSNPLLIRHDGSVDWINASVQSPSFNPRLFRILQVLTGVGLILGILGVSIGSHSTNGIFVPSTISKVGVLVYIVDFAAITIIFISSLPNVSAVPRPERPLILHIPIASLAIAVRLLYAALCIFLHNSTFSLFSGSVVADILMAVVEEFFVVVITLVLGFKLDRISPSVQGEIIILNQKGRNHGRQLPESKDGIYAQPSNSGSETFSSP